MSEFNPARPRYTLPFAGTDYELLGTLEVVEAVEIAFKDGIIQITTRTMDMGVTDTARLLAAVLTACGHKLDQRKAAQALLDLGPSSGAFNAIRIHLYAFLRITLEPPEAREEMARKMGEVTGKLSPAPASPGENTMSSA